MKISLIKNHMALNFNHYSNILDSPENSSDNTNKKLYPWDYIPLPPIIFFEIKPIGFNVRKSYAERQIYSFATLVGKFALFFLRYIFPLNLFVKDYERLKKNKSESLLQCRVNLINCANEKLNNEYFDAVRLFEGIYKSTSMNAHEKKIFYTRSMSNYFGLMNSIIIGLNSNLYVHDAFGIYV